MREIDARRTRGDRFERNTMIIIGVLALLLAVALFK
jgi:hypothetical protein